jgi:hypothetical protein
MYTPLPPPVTRLLSGLFMSTLMQVVAPIIGKPHMEGELTHSSKVDVFTGSGRRASFETARMGQWRFRDSGL